MSKGRSSGSRQSDTGRSGGTGGSGRARFRSVGGCCICGTKSSSSRFTLSQRYADRFEDCFGLEARDRSGDLCNACVLCVKRWNQRGGQPYLFRQVLDSKRGPGPKHMKEITKRARRREAREELIRKKQKPQLSTINSTVFLSSTPVTRSLEPFSIHGIRSADCELRPLYRQSPCTSSSAAFDAYKKNSQATGNYSVNNRPLNSTMSHVQSLNSRMSHHRPSGVTNLEGATRTRAAAAREQEASNFFRVRSHQCPGSTSFQQTACCVTYSFSNLHNNASTYSNSGPSHGTRLQNQHNHYYHHHFEGHGFNFEFRLPPSPSMTTSGTKSFSKIPYVSSEQSSIESAAERISTLDGEGSTDSNTAYSNQSKNRTGQSDRAESVSAATPVTRRGNRRTTLPPVAIRESEVNLLLSEIMEKNSEALNYDSRQVHMAVQRRLRKHPAVSGSNCNSSISSTDGSTEITCSSSSCAAGTSLSTCSSLNVRHAAAVSPPAKRYRGSRCDGCQDNHCNCSPGYSSRANSRTSI